MWTIFNVGMVAYPFKAYHPELGCPFPISELPRIGKNEYYVTQLESV